jgi:hypothetical protein
MRRTDAAHGQRARCAVEREPTTIDPASVATDRASHEVGILTVCHGVWIAETNIEPPSLMGDFDGLNAGAPPQDRDAKSVFSGENDRLIRHVGCHPLPMIRTPEQHAKL